MASKDIALMAHLMRRAGFGATYEELEARAAKGYKATIEELLDPDANGIPEYDDLTLARYYPDLDIPSAPSMGTANMMFHFYTSPRPLVEKMTLFWHMVFATGNSKVDNPPEMLQQIEMFRQHGMGNYRDMLIRLAKDPAMIFFLDNSENHKRAPNENWGRELLELFSMGQGQYTEDDVKMAARAFTGWTILPKIPRTPYQRHHWKFIYKNEDHDNADKEFLGHKGNLNGEDIIDIVLQQPATAQFMARHLYNFFVADEVQVPSWLDVEPKDPQAVNAIADVFVKSNFDITETLRFIFNSNFFKDESAWFAKVKNPAEVVAGTIRLIGDFKEPKPGVLDVGLEGAYQGQELINPPSVEGWHTGQEWIDTGSLVRRVNYVADALGDASKPGVQSIINRLGSKGTLSSEDLVDGCLELLGAVRVDDGTRQQLVDHAKSGGDLNRGSSEEETRVFGQRVTEMLQLIAATREYQFG
jgi:uncharacterized protein (DUF1800 family)